MLRLVSWQNFHHDIASILQPAIVHSAIELHIHVHATTRSVQCEAITSSHGLRPATQNGVPQQAMMGHLNAWRVVA